MRPKYIVLFVMNGITRQVEFDRGQKHEAIEYFKQIRKSADRARLFSIDSEDEEIWYDLSKNVLLTEKEG